MLSLGLLIRIQENRFLLIFIINSNWNYYSINIIIIIDHKNIRSQYIKSLNIKNYNIESKIKIGIYKKLGK